jgi:hypothetical protein
MFVEGHTTRPRLAVGGIGEFPPLNPALNQEERELPLPDVKLTYFIRKV